MSDFRVCSPAEFRAATPLERRKLVLAQVEATPEAHEQSVWIKRDHCGTTACVAGWATLLAGDQPHEALFTNFERVRVAGSERLAYINQRARELLDLEEDEAGVFGMSRPKVIEWLRANAA